MTLMKFSDPIEHEKNLSPLYATAAKSQVPIFGPDGYRNPDTVTSLNAAIQESMRSEIDPIVDLSAAAKGQNKDKVPENIEPDLTNTFKKSHLTIESQDDKRKGGGVESMSIYSSQELHDKSQNQIRPSGSMSKGEKEELDHIMLRRADAGYLFDCVINKKIVANDPWLQDVWEWVKGSKHTY